MEHFRITWRPDAGYFPTAPVTGEISNYIYRGQNLFVKGGGGKTYTEQWKGYVEIDVAGNNVTLTGTVALTLGIDNVIGTGTKFKAELIPGQLVMIAGRVYAVMKIVSDTNMKIDPVAVLTGAGFVMTYMKQMQEVDTLRASYIRGSIIRLPQGNLLGVGLGEVRLDGATVPGGGWTLRNQLALAQFDNGTGNFSIFKLGMKTPAAPTLATTGGGVKAMQPGAYSVRIVPARVATGGFNNPSEAVSVTITTAGDRINITFPAMDTAAGQDAWRVYGTLFSTSESVSGPWFFVDQITTSAVASGGGTFAFEWRDAEIQANDLLAFDNDPPPPGTFIASLGGFPVLIGTNGPGRTLAGTVATTNGSATVTGTGTAFDVDLAVGRFVWINNLLRRVVSIASATSMDVTPVATATASGLAIRSADEAPGPVIRPAKPYLGGFNIEAFPARFGVAINPPETIIGFVEGVGRLYLLTANRLHIAVLSGDPDVPVVVRPFWRTGFRNSRACAFINGFLYGFTTNGATRSAGAGDAVAEEHEFAAAVASDMETWNPSRVTVAYDPKNEAVLYIHADDGARASGKRFSTVLPYMLRLGVWSTPIRVEDPLDANDVVVTSAAPVNGLLHFLYTTAVLSTINQWDTGGGVGEVYAATPFMDVGASGFDKQIRGLQITAKGVTPINGQVYGVAANEDVPLSGLMAGTGSTSGDLSFTTGADIRASERRKLNVRRARLFAARIRLSLAVSGQFSRLDEIVLDGNVTKAQY